MQTKGFSGLTESSAEQFRHSAEGDVPRENHDIGMTQADLDRLPLGDYSFR